MNIIINCSNLKNGGGLQVANSICKHLNLFNQHKFIVVLSSKLADTYNEICKYKNVIVFNYDYKLNLKKILSGRDSFLDNLVIKYKSNGVITVFGPSYWIPKCNHLSGFARPHLVLYDSPYFAVLGKKDLLITKIKYFLLKCCFNRCSKFYFTENELISERLRSILKDKKIFTITNYYNQVYDDQTLWEDFKLPEFDGITLLTVTVSYPHKNLPIILDIAKILKDDNKIKFRFIITIDEKNFPPIPQELKDNILLVGNVKLSQCPSLYRQSNIMFQPSLLECFSATYPEAMKMKIPIITTDLIFSKGLCGNAALYYSPLNAKSAAEKIYDLSCSKELYNQLILRGSQRLNLFDNHTERVKKIINLMESISCNKI